MTMPSCALHVATRPRSPSCGLVEDHPLAAVYSARMAAGMRPRLLTSYPDWRAHSRTAATSTADFAAERREVRRPFAAVLRAGAGRREPATCRAPLTNEEILSENSLRC